MGRAVSGVDPAASLLGASTSFDSSQSEPTTAVDFKPLQLLMQTPVSVEYGEKLTQKLTMHEELLRCHSTTFDKRCVEATQLREQYAKSKTMTDKVSKFVFPEITAEQFDKFKQSEKASPLILEIYSTYPLEDHERSIQEIIEDAIQGEIGKKNTKVKERKGLKGPNEDLTADARLPLLNSQGVQHVAEKLFAALHRITKVERAKARKDDIKATAQHRILLPDVDQTTIQSFVDWIYRGTLQCRDANQVFALLNLSIQMGTLALTELCVGRLHVAASDCIQHALANGLGVEALFDSGSLPSNVVEVVFSHVIKSDKPPERLLQLVLDTIAGSLNLNLWAQFRESMSHQMTLQLIDAMVAMKAVKTEAHEAVLKSETDG